MTRTSGVARRELIGLDVRVLSPDKGMDGLAGRVVDETKNTLLVETSAGEKRVAKQGNRFAFRTGAHEEIVSGDEFTFQPEDRTKKVRS